MAKLPTLSGAQQVNAFVTLGWSIPLRRTSSHVILVKAGSHVTLSIPDHREVAKGTPRSLIRQAGVTVEEFNAAVS